MKKLLTVLLAVLMVLGLTACGGGSTATDTPADDGIIKADIVLITDAKSVDDRGFNQYSWEGVKAYAEPNGISHNYYMPTEQTTEQYLTQIDTAVKGGAKIIVCPGFLFGDAVSEAQFIYPDVKFICVDFGPADCQPNAIGVYFEEQESGFLAGYAAVKEGFTKLGFYGAMAVPAVKNFGYGYLAGADLAAQEMGLAEGDVTVKYSYTGTFDLKPEFVTEAKGWYTEGAEVIFGCGTPDNVVQAVDAYNDTAENKAWAIGVDSDESVLSQYVITSAMKNLPPVISSLIAEVYDGTFEGGRDVRYNAKHDAVALPTATESWRFKNFTQEEYKEVFAKLTTDDEFRTSLPTSSYETCEDFVNSGYLKVVKVDIVNDSK